MPKSRQVELCYFVTTPSSPLGSNVSRDLAFAEGSLVVLDSWLTADRLSFAVLVITPSSPLKSNVPLDLALLEGSLVALGSTAQLCGGEGSLQAFCEVCAPSADLAVLCGEILSFFIGDAGFVQATWRLSAAYGVDLTDHVPLFPSLRAWRSGDPV
jgi:hypothetical protein